MTIPNTAASTSADADNAFDENLQKTRIPVFRSVTRSQTKTAAIKEALEKKKSLKEQNTSSSKKKKTKPVKLKSSTLKDTDEEDATTAWKRVEKEYSNRKRYGDRRLREMAQLANAYIKLKRFVPTTIPFMRGMEKRGKG